jgi:hypothetical protein
MPNYRLTDERNGKSLLTFKRAEEPTEEYFTELKKKVGFNRNVPEGMISHAEYKPYKKRKRN